MRALHVFVKAIRESRRDLPLILLTVAFAPLLVALYALAVPSTTPTYTIAMLDADRGATDTSGHRLTAGAEIAAAIGQTGAGSGSAISEGSGSDRPVLRVRNVDSIEAGQLALRRGEVSALVVLGPDTSEVLLRMRDDPAARLALPVAVHGDVRSAGYVVTSVLASAALDGYVSATTGRAGLVSVTETPLGNSAATRGEFDQYVPGIMVFSVIMLVFQAAMVVARESESGAVRRLRMTRMTAIDFLSGTSAMLLCVGALSVAATFATAVAFGFTSQGSLLLAMAVTAVAALSVVAVGMMVAAGATSVLQAFIYANFPMGLLMFFSGAMFPIPKINLIRLGGHDLGPYDLLPPTHAVAALNKIFTAGAGLAQVRFELTALVVLTVGYFAIGTGLLYRFRLRQSRA